MASTRDRALDAAIDLVGTQGLRALTHARIDEHSGLPKGSTSNHFRTRAALFTAVVDGIVARELADLGPTATAPTTPDELVDALCAMLDRTVRTHRTLTTARLVMFLEASHHAPLREALDRGRVALRGLLVPVLAQLGARAPDLAADTIMACLEGLILHRIARHDRTPARPVIDLVVRAVFADTEPPA